MKLETQEYNPKVLTTLFIVIIITAAIWAFSPGISGSYFSDDFCYRTYDISSSPSFFLLNNNPIHGKAYRPLEFITLWITQAISGFDTTLQHCLQILIHLLTSYFLFFVLVKLGFNKKVSIITAIYMLFSQSAVAAVMSNDTISQQYGTLFGYLSIYFLHKALTNRESNTFKLTALSVFLYALAIFGKELSIGFLIPILAYIFYINYKNRNFKDVIILSVPFIIITVSYLIIRKSTGVVPVTFGNDRYNLHIGFNVIKNYIMLFVQGFIPFSSAEIFLSLKSGNINKLIAPLVFTFSAIVIPLIGYILKKKYKELFVLVILYLLIMSPTVLLNHVSELYTYQVLPLLALYIASGFIMLLSNLKHNYAKIALTLWLISILAINVNSFHSKTSALSLQGEKGKILYPQIKKIIVESAPNDTLNFLNRTDYPEYSIYQKKEFNIMKSGLMAIAIANGRSDLFIIVHEKSELSNPSDLKNAYIMDKDLNVSPFNLDK